MRISKSLLSLGNRRANREIARYRKGHSASATKAYAHERHEACDRAMNSTSDPLAYSRAVGEAGAFGFYASTGRHRFLEGK